MHYNVDFLYICMYLYKYIKIWIGRCMYMYLYESIKMHIYMHAYLNRSLYKTVLVLYVFQYIYFRERVGEDPTGPYLRVM